jgi:hypothetical protein
MPPQKGLTTFAVKALVFSVAEELMPGSSIDDAVSMAFCFSCKRKKKKRGLWSVWVPVLREGFVVEFELAHEGCASSRYFGVFRYDLVDGLRNVYQKIAISKNWGLVVVFRLHKMQLGPIGGRHSVSRFSLVYCGKLKRAP